MLAAYHCLHDSSVIALRIFFLLELSSFALSDSELPNLWTFEAFHIQRTCFFFCFFVHILLMKSFFFLPLLPTAFWQQLHLKGFHDFRRAPVTVQVVLVLVWVMYRTSSGQSGKTGYQKLWSVHETCFAVLWIFFLTSLCINIWICKLFVVSLFLTCASSSVCHCN